jgi:hypothetical protein
MRLLNIEYWAGKNKKPSVVLAVGVGKDGQLICLRSDKLSDSCVKKIRDNAAKLNSMDQGVLSEWLKLHLASYGVALTELKSGRYSIIEERTI